LAANSLLSKACSGGPTGLPPSRRSITVCLPVPVSLTCPFTPRSMIAAVKQRSSKAIRSTKRAAAADMPSGGPNKGMMVPRGGSRPTRIQATA